MGLDMYAFSVPATSYEGEVDFEPARETVDEGEYADVINRNEVAYWRKHNALHGWMENLYRNKGGAEESFNCVNVNLTEEDILNLQRVVLHRTLPETDGFFFGEDSRFDEYSRDETLKFCASALGELADSRKVYYTSWW